MNRFFRKAGVTVVLAVSSAAAYAQTVNMNSDAYKTGHLIGQVLGVIIIFVVIKKLFFSSKE